METLQITLPDAKYWMRTWCTCGELMPLTKLRRVEQEGRYLVRSECVCPHCQIWVKMLIPCELVQRYKDDPDLVAPAPN